MSAARRPGHRLRAVRTIALAAVVFCGCAQDPPPPSRPAVSAQRAASSATSAPEAKSKKTTSWKIEVHNLDDSIAHSDKVLAADPARVDTKKQLIGLLLERAKVLGIVSDLERVLVLAEELVKLAPDDPSAYMTRARALSAVHRFADALADLDRADEKRALPNQTRPQRGTVLLGLGRYDEACALLNAEAAERKDHSSKTLAGVCLSRQGKNAEADAAIAEAEAGYRGVSAFDVAWMAFERASIWDRAGEPDKAKPHYQRVVAHLPVHAHAVGHLAGLLPEDQAERALRQVLERSDDPEYKAALAAVLAKKSPAESAALLEEAKRGYAALMQKLPLAFADHAGWFYLGPAKDPERALEVAELNLNNRKTPEGYELSLSALLAVGDHDEACELAEQALSFAYPSPGCRQRAARAFEACGQAGRAAELRAAGDRG